MSSRNSLMFGASSHHSKVADVLGLVVQQCPDVSDMMDICQLLLVSSTVRQQLLRARGHGRVSFDTWDADEDWVQWTTKLVLGFMQWLPRHAVLVDSISLQDLNAPDVMHLALQLFTQALRHCRITALHESAAAGEPALQPLRLCSVQLGLATSQEDVLQLVPRALLQELAAAQTQKLSVDGGTLGAAAALQLGTSLQELQCEYMECSAVQLLPASLQVLQAAFVNGSGGSSNQDESSSGIGSNSPCCLDLQHLMQLRQLVCSDLAVEGLADEGLNVKLPAQVTLLRAHALLCELTGGTGLRCVDLLWHSLAELRSLRSIAGPWEVTVFMGYCPEDAEPATATTAAATLSTATGLSRLCVFAPRGVNTHLAFGGAQLCAALPSLLRLQQLYFRNLNVSCEELLSVTALTALRGLYLQHVAACDDAVAGALAHSLTGLTSFMLESDSISSRGAGLLTLCGRLTDLRKLGVAGVPQFGVGDAELMLLSRLTQLTYLGLSPQRCSSAGEARFLAGMPGLTSVAASLDDA